MKTKDNPFKARLENGKTNPEYIKCYRKKNPPDRAKANAAMRKYRASEKGKQSIKKYYQTETGKQKRAMYQVAGKFEGGEFGTRKCRDCGQIFDNLKVLSRGWVIFGNYLCICDTCAE
jgi:hypothetical protein